MFFIDVFQTTGRTGRFGRKGISINFVHNKETWAQMAQIEKALGRPILRVETDNVEEMEEVNNISSFPSSSIVVYSSFPF
jgi:superfamily II DNA/RNA helicase